MKIGDVVRLKSGGPAMTVIGSDGGATLRVVQVAWFHAVETGWIAVRDAFPTGAMERVDERDPEAHVHSYCLESLPPGCPCGAKHPAADDLTPLLCSDKGCDWCGPPRRTP